jgi:diguanylate cyclase (GGDEF)-like protein
MAASASSMVVALLFVAYLLDVLALRAFVNAAVVTLLFVIAFYAVFRSGLNLRFRDSSLTLPQILCSTLVILYALYESKHAHGVLALIYMVSFLFGVFRLSTRQLLSLTAFVALSYAVIIAVQWHSGAETGDFKLMLLNWIVLTAVLIFFSIMGGYISRLRKQVAEGKAQVEKALLRIESMAARDELTGLPNRRSLVDVLTRQKSRSDRYATAFSVLIVDIDFFKRVNDTLGHLAGDVVLKDFATAASASLRGTDLLGRYGGEEFMAVLDQTPLDRSAVVAARLCALARNLTFDKMATELRISISIGGAEYRKPEAWQATVERADKALYRAKDAGRDCFELENSSNKDVVQANETVERSQGQHQRLDLKETSGSVPDIRP